jgi:formylglycine-generating enzyme required for sulfatase activity
MVYDTATGIADFMKSGYRLPTEAQWEYACRAGSGSTYWWGTDTLGLGARVWCGYNATSTHPVATKPPNAWGLFDMAGNVFEWCNDWYGGYTDEAVIDPTGAPRGDGRVQRGGAWGHISYYDFTSAGRALDIQTSRNEGVGFRVVLP